MSEQRQHWAGDSQRARLKGFRRLRAILWPRSVRLVECLSLGHKGWYWKLRWSLFRGFSGIDPHAQERLDDQADIFGETPILTIVKLLELARGLVDVCPEHFVDLGSGRGTACFAAANLGFQALGLEKEKLWVERDQAISESLELSAEFRCQDFLRAAWPEPAVVFTIGTAFSPELRRDLGQRLGELPRESLVVTGDWDLGSGFEELWAGRLPVDWGTIQFRILRPGASTLGS